MVPQIEAWTAESSHLKHLIQLGRTHYPEGHKVLTEKYLKWFYLDNPEGPATLIVAHEGDLWIGLIVLIPIILESGGRPQKACFAVNVLTHPEHRGKGLFVMMIQYASDLLASKGTWLLGYPNVNAMPGWSRQKMQFEDPLHVFLTKFWLPFAGLRKTGITSLEQLKTIPSNFWNSLSDRPDMHLTYAPEFIAWRYLSSPQREYAVTGVERRGVLLGLLVTRFFKGPIDLMIDFVGPVANLSVLLRSVRRPSLIMHSGMGYSASAIQSGCWELPVRRLFPFFVTTWQHRGGNYDMTGITLAASDF
jgi:hypothetical protein